jgi:predicted transcriptional regulator
MRRTARHDIPPPLELECLKALWALGEGSVKDVRVALTRDRNLAYTTVMTILERLAKKARVARRKVGRSFVYVPLLGRDELRDLAVRDLVDAFFDGSEENLLAYLERAKPRARRAAEPEPLDTALL